VKTLEERVGVRLFERLHKQLILTPAGQAFLPEVSAGFRRISEATARLKPAGTLVLLTLGLHTRFELRRLAFARFRATHPEIGVRVVQPAGLHELERGQSRLAERTQSRSPPRLSLRSSRWWLWCCQLPDLPGGDRRPPGNPELARMGLWRRGHRTRGAPPAGGRAGDLARSCHCLPDDVVLSSPTIACSCRRNWTYG
jgi:DNA-binding transcriptional LysR family regulator